MHNKAIHKFSLFLSYKNLHMRKLMFASFMHTATHARVQTFPQLWLVSVTPHLSVINCLFKVSLRCMSHWPACHLHSASHTQTHNSERGCMYIHVPSSYQLDRYLRHLCHRKRPVCQERQRLSSPHTLYLSFPLFFPLFSLLCHATGSKPSMRRLDRNSQRSTSV